jgi:hypothetical protein
MSFYKVAGGTLHRCASIIHLVFTQTETHLVVIEIFQRSQSGAEFTALVLGMATRALLNRIELAVISFSARNLIPDQGMAGKAKHILGGLQRGVTAIALVFEFCMRGKTAQVGASTANGAHIPRAESLPAIQPD